MKRKYRNYTDQDIITFAKEVKSIAGLLRKLDLVCVGGNYATIKRHLKRLDIDTSHWTGRGWTKDQRLKDWTGYRRNSRLKLNLIKDRGHVCEECLNSIWRDVLIPLELEHIDGDRLNNCLENLKLLCPNCHALTPTWRRCKSSLS